MRPPRRENVDTIRPGYELAPMPTRLRLDRSSRRSSFAGASDLGRYSRRQHRGRRHQAPGRIRHALLGRARRRYPLFRRRGQQPVRARGRAGRRQGARRGPSLRPREVRDAGRAGHRRAALDLHLRARPRRDRPSRRELTAADPVDHRARAARPHARRERRRRLDRDPRRAPARQRDAAGRRRSTPASTSASPSPSSAGSRSCSSAGAGPTRRSRSSSRRSWATPAIRSCAHDPRAGRRAAARRGEHSARGRAGRRRSRRLCHPLARLGDAALRRAHDCGRRPGRRGQRPPASPTGSKSGCATPSNFTKSWCTSSRAERRR